MKHTWFEEYLGGLLLVHSSIEKQLSFQLNGNIIANKLLLYSCSSVLVIDLVKCKFDEAMVVWTVAKHVNLLIMVYLML